MATTPSSDQAAKQPLLTDLVTALQAPACAISARHGDIGTSAIDGFYVDDRRILSRLAVLVDGLPAEIVAASNPDPAVAFFVGLLPQVGDAEATAGLRLDPMVRIERTREVTATTLTETIELFSASPTTLRTILDVGVASDLQAMGLARAGRRAPQLPARRDRTGLTWTTPDGTCRMSAEPAPARTTPDELRWNVHLPPGGTWRVRLRVELDNEATAQLDADRGSLRDTLRVTSPDGTLDRLLERSLADLSALVRHDDADPDDRYICAGSPWYLTLFGRDSIWASRMLLPVDVTLAMGTLRALSRRQGTGTDPATAEQPGKILHEVRREPVAGFLPPVYYGTADATSLWICLLADAWRWGAPEDEIRALLPALHRALDWLAHHADPNGDGFIEYLSTDAENVLANQGWKDSADSIHDLPGTLLRGDVTLSEVQAYAHEAAVKAADLLDAFDEPGGDTWRKYAARLAGRFRSAFWDADEAGPYPVLALGPHGRRASSVGSNMGHLLGTGILTPDEAALIAQRLAGPDLDGGFGLRTLSTTSPRYQPLSYHNGSVWPHDTAIALLGMAREGLADHGAGLLRGLLAVARTVDFRLPELWGGEGIATSPAGSSPRPVPYPTACAPQAWSAATAVALVPVLLGLEVDVPDRTIRLRPMRPSPVGALKVKGIRVAGEDLSVSLAADGTVAVEAPAGFRVEIVNS